jgi:drug/metabolite transporter (DMT)-like permease
MMTHVQPARFIPMRSRLPAPVLSWQAQFLLLSAIWGASFLFIKVLGEHWPALWVAFGRILLGALTLLGLLALRGERLPASPRVWLHCAATALVFNSVPWVLFAYGEQHTSSIVAGLWNATTPLWVLVISLGAFSEERPTHARALGLAIGFVGVVTLLGPWRGLGGGQLIGHVACAGASLCYGIGFHYTRRYLAGRPETGLALSACQLIAAAAMLAPFLPLTAAPSTHIGLAAVGSLIALGGVCSGIAYVINYAIIRARGATVASTVTYVIPIVSTALGALVLGERLHWNQPLGAVLLLFGIAVSQGRLASALIPARARPERAGS